MVLLMQLMFSLGVGDVWPGCFRGGGGWWWVCLSRINVFLIGITLFAQKIIWLKNGPWLLALPLVLDSSDNTMMTTNDPIHSDIDDNDARTAVMCSVDDIIGIVSPLPSPSRRSIMNHRCNYRKWTWSRVDGIRILFSCSSSRSRMWSHVASYIHSAFDRLNQTGAA